MTDKTIEPRHLSIAFTSRDLCTRCGTCVAACPTGAISLDSQSYPVLNAGRCTECDLCAETCPGGRVDFQKLTHLTFGDYPDVPSFDGRYQLLCVGYTNIPEMRSGGAGGGVVTGLLWDMLKHGDVDACLVTRMNPEEPWRGGSFIADTCDELRASQGSKYSILPHMAVLKEIAGSNKRFAFAGLPCQIHGLRLLMEKAPALRERIVAIIGLFCGGAFEVNLVPELLQTKGVAPEDLKDFQFRGGQWPGKMRAILKSGETVDMHYSDYKDGAYNYLTFLYSPMRCLTCIDGSAHFADVAIGDIWTRDTRGQYRFPSHSRIFARTLHGAEIVKRAIARGTLVAQDVTQDGDYRTHRAHTKRKGSVAPIRIERLKRKGVPVPEYDRAFDAPVVRSDRVKEYLITSVNLCARRYWFRYPLLKFLTSRSALPLIWLRRMRKRYKYRQKERP